MLGSSEIAPNGSLAPTVPDSSDDLDAGVYYKLTPWYRHAKGTFAQRAMTGPLWHVAHEYVAPGAWWLASVKGHEGAER